MSAFVIIKRMFGNNHADFCLYDHIFILLFHNQSFSAKYLWKILQIFLKISDLLIIKIKYEIDNRLFTGVLFYYDIFLL